MANSIPESHSKRNGTRFYGFHTFAEPGFPVTFAGAFRDNVRQFIQQCAEPEGYDLVGMPIWCTFLVYEDRGTVLPLYTIEENVKHSVSPFCDYCRCAGWSHRFVSKRKYHFIIPANEEWNIPLEEGALDVQTHLLHGLIHCNGLGHLICINGIQGGSNFIRGREIMDLWDRICTALHARQITVEDLSRKNATDLRLLYGVAYGHSWFGKWGYRFCRGSFGVKEHNYERAVDILSSLVLDQVVEDFHVANNGNKYIKQLIHHYRGLSDTNLVTIRDLLRFMLALKPKAPTAKTASCTNGSAAYFPSWPRKESVAFSNNTPIKRCSSKFPTRLGLRKCPLSAKEKSSAKCRKFSNLAANLDSRWPVRRLEQVAEVIVDALLEKKAGMTRQEARDAARVHIGDTGLIDHVLKVMDNVVVGNFVVRRSVNRSTKILEYTIHDLEGGRDVYEPRSDFFKEKPFNQVIATAPVPGRCVFVDVNILYKNVLMGYPIQDSEFSSVNLAVQTVLHSKHFVKEWPFRDEDDDSFRFICRLTMSSFDENDSDLCCDLLHRECVVVPLYATLGDLRLAVENAMRDTYCVMENLKVTEILEMEGVQEDEVLFGVIESGGEIRVRGGGLDLETELRYEGGNENWTVRCRCGAHDDDGERMVACDICEIWQHTRCGGIEDSDAVPRLFVCDACCTALAPAQTRCGDGFSEAADGGGGGAVRLPDFVAEVDMGMMY
ncbi:hypothetical protein ABFS82_08G214100 [Erythranthe guttata]|uniref:Zinc finger PHD-type domain-containing protein n=1 Tax=Erythranthe guttata TaxID=4155 RepID=A0A022QWE6_ERYGU|nr:PREDICTED: PHD finger protein MALE MEIOCYTE DEATH 1 [Erythranthe guttata]EYU30865.1 hypothetical protein MIMGU_mgv1a002061mg [Erythranthe guttata]|eukprot:XP_012845315.1 PREDICTED: PHD finger protein MALE MEIOCYTE DEATH 1 [Erythranthe guttata]